MRSYLVSACDFYQVVFSVKLAAVCHFFFPCCWASSSCPPPAVGLAAKLKLRKEDAVIHDGMTMAYDEAPVPSIPVYAPPV